MITIDNNDDNIYGYETKYSTVFGEYTAKELLKHKASNKHKMVAIKVYISEKTFLWTSVDDYEEFISTIRNTASEDVSDFDMNSHGPNIIIWYSDGSWDTTERSKCQNGCDQTWSIQHHSCPPIN